MKYKKVKDEFKEAIKTVYNELSQFNKKEFEKILKNHKMHDFYGIILETKNLEKNEENNK